MIPRLHTRGTSFKEACRYILHDARKETDDRVLFAETLNILSGPEGAWHEMWSVVRDQAELKQRSGKDARGRKNTKPVMHYTLAWAASDSPSPAHMRETALSSLKALGLDQHQVLMAAHTDKAHMHVHIIVNTIHPETGLTAPLKYSKETLSRWAEAYEKEHGLHVDRRIKNNELREELKIAKRATSRLRNLAEPEPASRYTPVKHKPAQRDDWLDRKDILDRMKQLRKEVEPLLPASEGISKDELWKRQLEDRNILEQNTVGAVDHARTGVFERYRPQWRELYRAHKEEQRHLQRNVTHTFERAVFVFQNRERLSAGKEFKLRHMISLIRYPDRLHKRVEAIQNKERKVLASAEKTDKRVITKRLWAEHKAKFEIMRDRQAAERKAARSVRDEQLNFVVTFDWAKASLLAERQLTKSAEQHVRDDATSPAPHLAETFNTSVNTRSPTQMARVAAIKRRMEEWRQRHPGQDFGNEM